MTTISVPIPANMEEFVNKKIKDGFATNKADLFRKAIIRLSEEEAVNEVLRAEREPDLRGDLRDLAKKLRK